MEVASSSLDASMLVPLASGVDESEVFGRNSIPLISFQNFWD
jgi:hypothetical protein